MKEDNVGLIFSIIVPIYKIDLNFLEKCLNSLVNQTLEKSMYEIILVDDNNHADDCGKMCETYKAAFDNVKVIHQENAGVSVARNEGILKSEGKYLIFVDGDDWVVENMLEIMYLQIKKFGELDLFIFSAFVNYPNRELINRFWDVSNQIFGVNEKELLQLQLISRKLTRYFPKEITCGVPWAKLYKKETIVKKHLFFDKQLSRMQDNIFNLYFIEYAISVVYVDIPVYHYRKSELSVTNKANKNVVQIFEKVNEAVLTFNNQFNKDKRFYNALKVKILLGINSYYLLYFGVEKNKTNKIKYEELLRSEPYDSCLKTIRNEYLTSKEKVFIFALKTRKYSVMVLLQTLEKFLKKLTKRELY